MIKFLAKTAGVIALLILFMVFLKNPLETSVGIAVMGGWIGLMFTPHFRREMKKGRAFKQICKEDVFVFNSSYQNDRGAYNPADMYKPSLATGWNTNPAYSHLPFNIYHNRR